MDRVDACVLGSPRPSGEAISAQLLLSAQEELRCAYPSNTLPLAVAPSSLLEAATNFLTPPCEAATRGPQLCLPTMPSLESSAACTLLATPSVPTGFSEPPHPPKTLAALALALEQPDTPPGEGRINFMDTHARRKSQSQSEGEGTGDSSCGDDCRSSRSSTADSRKRRRRTALPETPGPDSLVSGLLLDRERLQARCAQLQSDNTRLMCHLTVALQVLQRERASAQAEANSLRQKCNALGAFLPPSVAAFARGIPPGSDLFTRKGLQRAHPQP